MIRKADTDYLLYIEACQRGLIVPLLPADFRRLSNNRQRYAFQVAERALQRAVATLMRRSPPRDAPPNYHTGGRGGAGGMGGMGGIGGSGLGGSGGSGI